MRVVDRLDSFIQEWEERNEALDQNIGRPGVEFLCYTSPEVVARKRVAMSDQLIESIWEEMQPDIYRPSACSLQTVSNVLIGRAEVAESSTLVAALIEAAAEAFIPDDRHHENIPGMRARMPAEIAGYTESLKSHSPPGFWGEHPGDLDHCIHLPEMRRLMECVAAFVFVDMFKALYGSLLEQRHDAYHIHNVKLGPRYRDGIGKALVNRVVRAIEYMVHYHGGERWIDPTDTHDPVGFCFHKELQVVVGELAERTMPILWARQWLRGEKAAILAVDRELMGHPESAAVRALYAEAEQRPDAQEKQPSIEAVEEDDDIGIDVPALPSIPYPLLVMRACLLNQTEVCLVEAAESLEHVLEEILSGSNASSPK